MSTRHYTSLSEDLGEAMVGINEDEIQLIMEARGQ